MNLFQKQISQVKTDKMRKSFDQISGDYDSLNDVTSLGLHRIWKSKLAEEITGHQFWKILDVCCGTGDLALLLAQKNANAQITAIDFSEEMLRKARYRQQKGKISNVEFLCQDAAHLSFREDQFDCVAISFGLRNVLEREKVLREMYRVLRPGGMFYCLDTVQMEHPAAQNAMSLYRKGVVPAVSGFLAGNPKEYVKLAHAHDRYLTKKQLVLLLQKCGFEKVGCIPYSHGIVVCHRAAKPENK